MTGLPVAGKAGDFPAAPSVEELLRLGIMRELIANMHGDYMEVMRNARVFHTLVKAVTIAATHNSPIAANTATPVIGLANPDGSGKVGIPLRCAFLTTSGTPAGGQGIINRHCGAAQEITATATGNIYAGRHKGTKSPQGSVMTPFNNVALAGWVASGSPVEELALVGGAAAAAAAGNGGPGAVGEDLKGMFSWGPGDLIALMAGSGAGTSWIVNAHLMWAEVDAALFG